MTSLQQILTHEKAVRNDFSPNAIKKKQQVAGLLQKYIKSFEDLIEEELDETSPKQKLRGAIFEALFYLLVEGASQQEMIHNKVNLEDYDPIILKRVTASIANICALEQQIVFSYIIEHKLVEQVLHQLYYPLILDEAQTKTIIENRNEWIPVFQNSTTALQNFCILESNVYYLLENESNFAMKCLIKTVLLFINQVENFEDMIEPVEEIVSNVLTCLSAFSLLKQGTQFLASNSEFIDTIVSLLVENKSSVHSSWIELSVEILFHICLKESNLILVLTKDSKFSNSIVRFSQQKQISTKIREKANRLITILSKHESATDMRQMVQESTQNNLQQVILDIKTGNEEVATIAANTIWNSALQTPNEELKQKLKELSGIQILIAKLEQTTKKLELIYQNKTLQTLTVTLLGAMATLCSNDKIVSQWFFEANVLDCILRLIHQHWQEIQINILVNSLTVLINMSGEEDQVTISITNSPQCKMHFKRILELIEFPNRTVADRASALLLNLSADSQSCSIIRELFAIEQMVSHLDKKEEVIIEKDTNEQSSDISKSTANIAAALWNLSLDDENLEDLEKTGGINKMVDLLPKTNLVVPIIQNDDEDEESQNSSTVTSPSTAQEEEIFAIQEDELTEQSFLDSVSFTPIDDEYEEAEDEEDQLPQVNQGAAATFATKSMMNKSLDNTSHSKFSKERYADIKKLAIPVVEEHGEKRTFLTRSASIMAVKGATGVTFSGIEEAYRLYFLNIEYRAAFREYLHSQSSVEFLDFLIFIYYKFLPSNGDGLIAHQIMDTFINPNSSKELNIVHSLRKECMDAFAKVKSKKKVPLELFDKITDYVEVYVFHELFVPFKTSAAYSEFVESKSKHKKHVEKQKEKLLKNSLQLKQFIVQNKLKMKEKEVQSKRARPILGLYSSEKAYISVLDYFTNRLSDFSKQQFSMTKNEKFEDVTKLLTALQRVQTISASFVAELMSKISSVKKSQVHTIKVGKLISSRISTIRLYKKYAEEVEKYYPKLCNQPDILQQFEKYFAKEFNPLKRIFLQHDTTQYPISKNSSITPYTQMNLLWLFRLPLRQVKRYETYVQQILHSTDRKHEDYKYCKENVKQIKKILDSCSHANQIIQQLQESNRQLVGNASLMSFSRSGTIGKSGKGTMGRNTIGRRNKSIANVFFG